MNAHNLFTKWTPLSRAEFSSLTKGRRFATEVCTTIARDAEIVATVFLSKHAPAFLVAKEVRGDNVEFSHYRAEGEETVSRSRRRHVSEGEARLSA